MTNTKETNVKKTNVERRTVHYENINELLADAERLSQQPTQQAGNWTLGQVCQHLAKAFRGSLDGLNFRVPWFVRVMAKLFMKKRFLTRPVPSGFQIPKESEGELLPETISDADGLEELRAAIQRLNKQSPTIKHPVLGKLTGEEWLQFHCRHAEMHMSFIVPTVSESNSV